MLSIGVSEKWRNHLITQLLIEDLVEDIEGSEMNVNERITALPNYFCGADFS